MRILQLTGDWKWTGPAEPMLRLGLALRARGHDVALACPEPADTEVRSLASEARAAGLAPDVLLSRGRGVHPWRDRREARRLCELAAARGIQVVHAWHSRDHALALAIRRRTGARVVRTWRRAEGIPAAPWHRWLFGPGSDGVWCVSPETATRNAPLRGGRPIAGGFGAVDLARFRPASQDPALRAALGLPPDARVVGIVARVQPHRRFELLLEAARRLFERDPRARLLVVGRGTRREQVAVRPAQRLGIADRVVFAGYRTGDYADVLRSLDVFTLLVPGSDGSCRAALEAAAVGLPAVVTRRGALPEIVADGETGLVVDETPEALAEGWARLLSDTEERRRLGAAAARRARTLFPPERLAEGVEALYRAALEPR